MPIQTSVIWACFFASIGLVLSLLVLLAGFKTGFLENAAIARSQVPESSYYAAQYDSIHYFSFCHSSWRADSGSLQTNLICPKTPLPISIYSSMKTPFYCLLAGIGFTGLSMLLLPLFFYRITKWRRLMHLISAASLVLTILGAISGTMEGEANLMMDFPDGPGRLYLPLLWTATAFVMLASGSEFNDPWLMKYINL